MDIMGLLDCIVTVEHFPGVEGTFHVGLIAKRCHISDQERHVILQLTVIIYCSAQPVLTIAFYESSCCLWHLHCEHEIRQRDDFPVCHLDFYLDHAFTVDSQVRTLDGHAHEFTWPQAEIDSGPLVSVRVYF